MLKNFTLAFIFLFGCTAITAQNIDDDFEGTSTITSWFGDDCNLNTALANPHSQGSNTSATVAEYHDIGGVYANVRFDVGRNLDLSKNGVFSLKIYIPSSGLTGNQNNQISLKLQDGSLPSPWSTQSEIIKPLLLDQWQTISFDFSSDPYMNLDPTSLPPAQRSDFNRVIIQCNGENNSDEVLAYIDDFFYQDSTGGSSGSNPNYNQLVWSDEFNGNGALDSSKWFAQSLLPNGSSWYNGEVQHYTDRTDNAFESNGTLKIVAKKETFTDQGVTKQFTSARLNSKFAFTYGRVEVKAILPTGSGTWPAIWTLGKNIIEPGAYWTLQGNGTQSWPACGEIDIMEHWGSNQDYVSSAMHTPSSFGGTVNHGGRVIPNVSNSFHIYELEWSPTKMVFSVDGIVHYVYEPAVRDAATWPFVLDQYILLNIAIEPSIDPAFTQSEMEIDYVRVYQSAAIGLQENKDSRTNLRSFPNPVKDHLQIELSQPSNEIIDFQLMAANGQHLSTISASADGQTCSLENLGNLKAGVYWLQFSQNGQAHHVKFIKI
jgi:beta-glucanase (GH16 family)